MNQTGQTVLIVGLGLAAVAAIVFFNKPKPEPPPPPQSGGLVDSVLGLAQNANMFSLIFG